MSIQLDPELMRGIRGAIPRGLLLVISAVLLLPGAGLGGWYLYCEYLSGTSLGMHELRAGEQFSVELEPQMNPISVVVGEDSIGASKRKHRSFELTLTGPGDAEVSWTGGFKLRDVQSGSGLRVRTGPARIDPERAIGLGTLSVSEAGAHTFHLERKGMGAAAVGGNLSKVQVALRRNARSFPLLLGILGMVLAGLGVLAMGVAWPKDSPGSA